jgi:hypothetical protein
MTKRSFFTPKFLPDTAQERALIKPTIIHLCSLLNKPYKYRLEAYSEVLLQVVLEHGVLKVTLTPAQTLLSPWKLISRHATDSLTAWRCLLEFSVLLWQNFIGDSASWSSSAEGSQKPTNLATCWPSSVRPSPLQHITQLANQVFISWVKLHGGLRPTTPRF